ncbi:MAG: hypothetical protein KDB01_27930 [Planctomycetaceae bacterium]|nr:hypothetical protein [Planctomycetaceae bacterium]
MTIKFTCTGCGSVMSIKDEKAGTKAKCPKCKIPFVVPLAFESASDLDDDDDNISAEVPKDDADEHEETAVVIAKKEPLPLITPRDRKKVKVPISLPEPNNDDENENDDEENDLDMPLDLTPGSPSVPAKAFDPLDVLDDKTANKGKTRSTQESKPRKASVADMMRGFDAGPSVGASSASPAKEAPTVAETTGTAADALARAYQQKRDNASNPKAKVKEVSEEQQLFMEWLVRVVPAILLTLVLSYGLYWLINGPSYNGPPLADVSGKLTQGGTPLVGYNIRFVPALTSEELNSSGEKGSPPPRSTSSGVTDDKGLFTLSITADYDGSCLGDHTVEILDPSGIPVFVPDGYLNQTVTEDGIPDLQMDLN